MERELLLVSKNVMLKGVNSATLPKSRRNEDEVSYRNNDVPVSIVEKEY